MPAARGAAAHTTKADSSAAVDAFLAGLEHPMKAEVVALRSLVLGVDPAVREGIKWNAPSYRTTAYFATTHLRSKVGVGLVLHLGAKARALPPGGLQLDDPDGLLRWLAPDRAVVELRSGAELEERRLALHALLAQWIRYV
jgi:hypothetical protein